MSLFIVTVDATDQTGAGWYFEVAVLAETERGARRMATREIVGRQHTGVHSVDARQVDPHKSAVVLVRRKEVME